MDKKSFGDAVGFSPLGDQPQLYLGQFRDQQQGNLSNR